MRTVKLNIYEFFELKEVGKKEAIRNFSEINTEDIEWWKSSIEDAARVGLTINNFNIQYEIDSYEWTMSCEETAEAVLKAHCEEAFTNELAKAYMKSNKNEDMQDKFRGFIINQYGQMLKREYDYQTSEFAIIESIERNGCEFLEDGKHYSD